MREIDGSEPAQGRATPDVEVRGAYEALRCGARLFKGPEAATLTAAPFSGKGVGVSGRGCLTLPRAVRTVGWSVPRADHLGPFRAVPLRERVLS